MYDKELVFEAINRACRNKARNMSYIDAILRDWTRKGYKTLDDIENEKKTSEDDVEQRVRDALDGK